MTALANSLVSYMFSLQPVKKKRKSVYCCPHCRKDLSWKTYSQHQRLYFNINTKQWITDVDIGHSTDHGVDGDISQQVVCDMSESPPPSPTDFLAFAPIESQDSDTLIDPPNEGKGLQDI